MESNVSLAVDFVAFAEVLDYFSRIDVLMALEQRFGQPADAKLALERRFGRPADAKLALERRFGRSTGAKLALEQRFGRPDGVKLALERRFGRPAVAPGPGTTISSPAGSEAPDRNFV